MAARNIPNRQGNIESDPLLTTEQSQNSSVDINKCTYNTNICVQLITWLFNVLCFLTGQYIYSGSRRWVKLLLASVLIPLLLNTLLNLFSVGFDIYTITKCPFSEYCGFIYTLPHMRNISNYFWKSSPKCAAPKLCRI